MMDGDLTWSWLFGVCFGVLLGSAVVGCNMGNYWQKEAIRHGAAHYDKQSGAFAWNESEAK
jgi:hypothetical protein